MREIVIDGRAVRSMEDIQSRLKTELSFPHWYGNNLDALHDCLTEISGKVRLLDWEAAEVHLGTYGKQAKKVIAAAALHNTDLDLYI